MPRIPGTFWGQKLWQFFSPMSSASQGLILAETCRIQCDLLPPQWCILKPLRVFSVLFHVSVWCDKRVEADATGRDLETWTLLTKRTFNTKCTNQTRLPFCLSGKSDSVSYFVFGMLLLRLSAGNMLLLNVLRTMSFSASLRCCSQKCQLLQLRATWCMMAAK